MLKQYFSLFIFLVVKFLYVNSHGHRACLEKVLFKLVVSYNNTFAIEGHLQMLSSLTRPVNIIHVFYCLSVTAFTDTLPLSSVFSSF